MKRLLICLSLMLAMAAAANAQLLFYYGMNETLPGEPVVDYSTLPEFGGSPIYDAVNVGGVSGQASVSGKYGTAYSFASGTHLNLPTDGTFLNGTKTVTAMAWVKAAAPTGIAGSVIDINNALKISILWSGKVRAEGCFYYNSNNYSYQTADSLSSIVDGNWHHIALVWNGIKRERAISLYIDGQLISQSSTTYIDLPIIESGTEYSYIGKNKYPDQKFNGSIDEVGLWNEALTQADIQNIMNNPIPEPATLAILGAGLLFVRRKK